MSGKRAVLCAALFLLALKLGSEYFALLKIGKAVVMREGLPKGVIFDMDGVLLDSERFICEAAIKMFAEKGLKVQEKDFLDFVGTGENRYIGGVAEKYGFAIDIERDKGRTYDIYEELIKSRLKALTGAVEFIEKCRKMGKKIAIASSADMRKVRTNLLETGIGFEVFDAVVVGEDVERKKPWPDIFLKAAEKLGLNARECLVIEDAVNGVAAAKAAGARCVGIMTSFGEEALREADWRAKDLAEVPDEALRWEN